MTRGKNNVRLIVAAFFLHNHLGCFRKQAEVNVMSSLWCIKGLAPLIWLFPHKESVRCLVVTHSRDKWFSPYTWLFSQSMKDVFMQVRTRLKGDGEPVCSYPWLVINILFSCLASLVGQTTISMVSIDV